jgi:hypothetical protein
MTRQEGDLRSLARWNSRTGPAQWTATAPGVLPTGRERALAPGWHTAAMSDVPPPDPKANDVWIDDHGELRYFNGTEWVPYPDVPDGDLQPEVVIKGEEG